MAEQGATRYERQDVAFPHLAAGLIATLAVLLLSVLLVMWIYPSVVVDRRIAGPLPQYPAPRLQTDPATDMRRFLAKEMTQLNSSGWIDRAQGVAHIPIDEAMQRTVRQGIADWPTQGNPP
jgi:hypothetical protein